MPVAFPAINQIAVRQFQQLMQKALLAGTIAGALLFVYQCVVMVPQILQAETYEDAADSHGADAGAHEHAEWKPANGWERNALTAFSTILTGIGFAALLVGAVTLSGFELDVRRGLLWGFAGFVCFAVAPSLGLPPVPPGVPEADVQGRQLWWLMTAVSTAAALFLLLAVRRGWGPRVAGGVLLVLPHIIGAPHASGPAIVPDGMLRAFVIASIAGSCLFWLTLGAATGYLFRPRQVH